MAPKWTSRSYVGKGWVRKEGLQTHREWEDAQSVRVSRLKVLASIPKRMPGREKGETVKSIQA